MLVCCMGYVVCCLLSSPRHAIYLKVFFLFQFRFGFDQCRFRFRFDQSPFRLRFDQSPFGFCFERSPFPSQPSHLPPNLCLTPYTAHPTPPVPKKIIASMLLPAHAKGVSGSGMQDFLGGSARRGGWISQDKFHLSLGLNPTAPSRQSLRNCCQLCSFLWRDCMSGWPRLSRALIIMASPLQRALTLGWMSPPASLMVLSSASILLSFLESRVISVSLSSSRNAQSRQGLQMSIMIRAYDLGG